MASARWNIAVIGSGIAGLGAAMALHPYHDITVYEKNMDVGGHARTVAIDYAGQPLAVDTGFIVFNHRNYPNLTALFRHLDVATAATSMTFGMTTIDGSLEWGAQNLNALFAQRRNLLRPEFYRFLGDILKFNRGALAAVAARPDLTLGGLIDAMGLGDWFRNYYILPMGGAIWSAPLPAMLDFPAPFFVKFFEAHGLLTVTQQPQWRTVVGGSRAYIDKLIAPFRQRIHTSTGVAAVTRINGKVQVTNEQGDKAEYDHVVFACPGPTALALLADATPEERNILGALRCQRNTAFLHRHERLMPRRKACWSSWVYHAPRQITADPISVTYWMNRLQHIDCRYPLFVTLNPIEHIPEHDIFDRHVFYHPVYDPAAVRAQKDMAGLQGRNGIWYCGAYTRNGFHEDGLASALAVAENLGGRAPW